MHFVCSGTVSVERLVSPNTNTHAHIHFMFTFFKIYPFFFPFSFSRHLRHGCSFGRIKACAVRLHRRCFPATSTRGGILADHVRLHGGQYGRLQSHHVCKTFFTRRRRNSPLTQCECSSVICLSFCVYVNQRPLPTLCDNVYVLFRGCCGSLSLLAG